MTQPPERAALAREMDARRDHLGLSWADVAEHAGVAVQTLHRIRKGSAPIKVSTRGSIEAALRWRSSSINAILAGGSPTPEEDASPAPQITQSPAGGMNLWIATPRGQVMVPLAFDAIPGLRETTEEDRAAITDGVVTAMTHAASVYLAEEGRRRQGAVGDESDRVRPQNR